MGGPAPKTPNPTTTTKQSGTTQTPARARYALDRLYSVKPYPPAQKDYHNHATDMGTRIRGPVPLNGFFKDHVPLHGEDWNRSIQFGKLKRGKEVMFSEEHIRLRALQLGLCRGQTHFCDTHDIPALAYPDGERVLRRPDMLTLCEDILNDSDLSDVDRLRALASLTEWFLDLKKANQDPFGYYAGEKRWTKDSLRSIDARGQFAMYGHMMFENGHRVFGFSVVIMPKAARLIRFDRSGIIFSERFDWRTSWALPTFMHRYERMTPAERGWDTSVSRMSPTATQDLLNDAVIRDMLEALPKQTVKPLTPVNGTLFKFEVWDEEERSLHTLIAGLPQTRTHTLTGRSTRGYIAYDMEEKSLVYMKDTFRVGLETLRKESDVYRVLEKAKVPHLPEFRYGGDVPALGPDLLRAPAPASSSDEKSGSSTPQTDASTTKSSNSVHPSWKTRSIPVQTTRTADYNDAPWLQKRDNMKQDPETLIHHRIVLKKIGRPLRDFESTRQLAVCICDAVEAHAAAYDAGVLHRDISGGNILIDNDGRGLLIDWELSRFTDDTSPAHREYRTGTWAFMAAELCQDQRAADHLLRHDFESFVHVLFYHVFRYCKMEGADPEDIHMGMAAVFEDKQDLGDRQKGGMGKVSYCLDALPEFRQKTVVEASSLPKGLKKLLAKVRAPFKTYYDLVEANEDEDDEEESERNRQRWAKIMKNFQRSSYFYDDVWAPVVNNATLWPGDNDSAAADQFPPKRVKQWNAARRGKTAAKSTRSGSKRQKNMKSEPVPCERQTRSMAKKVIGVDSVSTVTKIEAGASAKLGSKRKFDDTAIAEEDDEEFEGNEEDHIDLDADGGADFEPEEDEDDANYVDDLKEYTRPE